MPAGLTIYNDAYTVQVDEKYRNLSFREKRSFGVSFGQYMEITITGEAAVVAMRSGELAPVLLSADLSSGVWTYKWRFDQLSGGGTPETGSADLYIFDVPPANVANMGFEIYDASGRMVFHSNVKPLKIAPSGLVIGHSNAYSNPTGRPVAPMILGASIFSEFYGSPINKFFDQTWALMSAGSTIWPAQREMQQGFVGTNEAGSYFAVDVTGLT